MFNPQWLRSFSLLAELGNFTLTAEQLGITQAAVSQHIRHLENHLGPLLIRKPRQVDLTPTGQKLLDYCHELEQAQNKLTLRLSEADAEHGDIRIISPGSIGLKIYPLLLDWQKANPGLTITHRFAPDQEVVDQIIQNHYELGLVTFQPDNPKIAAQQFTEEALELVVPRGRKACSWQDLEHLGFIDHPDGQAMATRFLSRRFPGNPGVRKLPQHGFSNQIGLLLEPVARGLGFTILPQYARQAFHDQSAIEVIACGVNVVDKIWLIHRAEWPLSARAQRVIEYLETHID